MTDSYVDNLTGGLSNSTESTTVNLPLTNSQQEIAAMTAIAESLAPLDESGVRRVMTWVGDHFGYRLALPSKPRKKK